MLRTQFLEIDSLRKMISQADAEGRGWPTCILNVKAQQEYRPEVRGPLSLFINLQGRSHCKVGSHEVSIDTERYFLSNSGAHYDFLIDETVPTETFNIHIEEKLMDQVYAGLTLSESKLLDQPDQLSSGRMNFFSQLYQRDVFLDGLISEIRQGHFENGHQKMLETEQMSRLLVHLATINTSSLLEMRRLPALREATRRETYRRLIQARDYIHSCYDQELTLDKLAEVACMSRYHFLRAFKGTFRCTPYQYLKNLRIEKAQWLLRKSDCAVTDIGLGLGYQNLSSFSRVFRQMLGTGPQRFREEHA
ncbi:MAG TPA: AraC family transcriptional regulator [Bacteroidetes bacterium]|nr:AraC family transcriptional regulator [Bacteroidota bacterium]